MASPTNPYTNPPRLPEGDVVDPRAVFAGPVRERPFELEIGPGRGAFILERAASAPHVAIVGLEIRRKWACIVDEKLAERGLAGRARVLCEDARLALPRLGPEGIAARVFIHFPDPWWKKRHEKRLVVVDPVVVEVARLLADGGELFVQTDVLERAEQYRAVVGRCPDLEPAGEATGNPILQANPYPVARTNREKHADRDGLPVHRLRYRRRPR
ncbi:MAG: tRNA (guanine-N7)-methyltransferase [Myxococcota bacterium]